MKQFRGLVLCDWHEGRASVCVTAELKRGALTLSGCDAGSVVQETWGDSDYEYCFHLSPANTEKLLAAIHGTEDPEAALLREFSGANGCRALRELCEKNGIRYEFHSFA